jgi:anti-anti-sigma factor
MVSSLKQNEYIIIQLEGSILQIESDQLRRLLENHYDNKDKNIIIDMLGTNHICSSALGHLVFAKNKLRSFYGDIKFVAADEDLLELLDLTMLNQVFEIYSDLETAKASFKQ